MARSKNTTPSIPTEENNMEIKKDNPKMDLWNMVATTDPTFTKPIEGRGFKGTDINPTYRAMKMTEMFGPFGMGWGIEKLEYEQIPINDADTGLICTLSLWYMVGGMKCIAGPCCGGEYLIRKGRFDDEAYKKCSTDAMTQVFRWLGISADVYMGLWDNSKYQASLKESEREDGKSYFGHTIQAPVAPGTPTTDEMWKMLRDRMSENGHPLDMIRKHCQDLISDWTKGIVSSDDRKSAIELNLKALLGL